MARTPRYQQHSPRSGKPPAIKDLFPHLGRLQRQLIDLAPDPEASKILLDQSHFCLAGVVHWLFEFAKVEREIVSRYTTPVGSYVYQAISYEERNRLALVVDAYLGIARRPQDFSLRQVAARFGTSVPQSMNELVKRQSCPTKVSTEVWELVCNYWGTSGLLLKQYRDLSTHAAIVASEATVLLRPRRKAILSVLLPNNPTEKSPSKLRYEGPVVHASTFLQESAFSLLKFAHHLFALLATTGVHGPRLGASFGVRAVVGFREENFRPPLDSVRLRDRLLTHLGEPSSTRFQ